MTPRKSSAPASGAALIVLLVVAFFGLNSTLYTLNQTQQAVVLQFGKLVGSPITEPGLKFKLPWQNIRIFDKRAQILKLDAPADESVLLSDQRPIVVDAYLVYRIVEASQYLKTFSTANQAEDRMKNSLNASLRQVLGTATLQDILSTKRGDVMKRIQASLNRTLTGSGLVIDDMRITRADFPVATRESIYNRMRAEREREAAEARAQGAKEATRLTAVANAERTVILANADRDAAILRGKGDQEAAKTYADAYAKDPDFYGFWRSMQAYSTALSPAGTTILLTPGQGFLQDMQSPN